MLFRYVRTSISPRSHTPRAPDCTKKALAGITLPHVASVALHESMGFEAVGVHRRIGYKLGSWHDVGWWELRLAAYDESPGEPRAFGEL